MHRLLLPVTLTVNMPSVAAVSEKESVSSGTKCLGEGCPLPDQVSCCADLGSGRWISMETV